jgi:signal transduction histidine kinase
VQTGKSSPSIIAIGNPEIHQSILNNWREYEHHNSLRAIKKQFRHNKPALIIACIANESDEQLSKDITQYVRNGLANEDTRIVLIHEPAFELDEISWMEDLHVNGCLSANKEKQSFHLTTLNREIDTFLYIDNNRRQHDAEVEMLMCISQFSRTKEPLDELLKKFSASLSQLCHSACSFHLNLEDSEYGHINYCNHEDQTIVQDLNQAFGFPQIPRHLEKIINERHPQIDLLPESIKLQILENKIGKKIGSYLTFPITAYQKIFCLMVYLIPEDKMDKVSMKQINVINKASGQLTMLLERRQAEDSLKKQYQRLKNALVELKTTKQELHHKEKMASIGQMAAGIAHEINNPLSYVISNFSSLDNYLNSIIQLQELQSQFLESIDSEQEQKIQEMKSNISKFEEEEDIDFILEDIRAVVSDSHNGLKRVKNIITDLKSFTYSQSTKLENCNLHKVIDDTIKLLEYEMNPHISIKKQVENLPDFLAHNGLMQQVLTNLIKNAAQALSEANTEKPEIVISAVQIDSTIVIKIRDNGPGISDGYREKIFEPFFTTKTVGEGTGLGLSVSFNIVKKLGGTINLDSKANEFTEFTITFPIKNKENTN